MTSEKTNEPDVFTPDQVQKLWKHQFGPYETSASGFPIVFHPYTCLNRGDGKHREFGGDLGVLIPTVRGWICPCCNYTQNWSHETRRAS